MPKDEVEVVEDTDGTRLLNIEDLNKAVKKMACPGCIDDAAGIYLRKFFDYSDKHNTNVFAQAEKQLTAEKKYAHLKKNLLSTGSMYNKFSHSRQHKTKHGGIKRVDHFHCPMEVKTVSTTGFAAEVVFCCSSKRFFSDKDKWRHTITIKPRKISKQLHSIHNVAYKNFEVNHRLCLAMQLNGCGGTHLETIAAIIGHPWNTAKKCFRACQDVVGFQMEKLKDESLLLARLVEKKMTKALGNFITDFNNNVGIIAGFDGFWPKRATGHSYDSKSGASFLVAAISGLILHLKSYSKECSIC